MSGGLLGRIAKLLGGGVDLDRGAQARLDAWCALPEASLDEPFVAARLVVVDVESSGLDLRADRLIAVGAIEVDASRVLMARGFHAVLRQTSVSNDDNILLHRIGGTAQEEGLPPESALLDFLEYVGKAPLVGYHAAFDERMIAKTARQVLGEKFRRTWLDLAALAPALCPDIAPRMKGLDDWCAEFGIVNAARHDALADALSTAQLLQVLLARASDRGMQSLRDLFDAARGQAWLDRARR